MELITPVFVDHRRERGRARAEAESLGPPAGRVLRLDAHLPTVSHLPRPRGARRKELSGLARERRFAEMPALVPDALLDTVAVSAEPAGVGEAIRARYPGDLVQRRLPLHVDPGG